MTGPYRPIPPEDAPRIKRVFAAFVERSMPLERYCDIYARTRHLTATPFSAYEGY